MSPEERFLKQATQGLSRRKRAEAQAELRSHLHERIRQLILAGKPLPSAQAQAMQELGAPGQIARGLRRNEHVHPLLSAAVLAAMAGLLLGFPALDSWQNWRNNNDSRRANSTEAELRKKGYISLPEARKTLAASGIGLSFSGPWAKLTAPGLPTIALNSGSDTYDTYACSWPVYADPRSNRLLPELRPAHLYVAPETLVGCLAQSGWPLEVRPGSVMLRGKALPYLPGTAPAQAKVTLPEFDAMLQSFLYTPRLTKLLGPSASLSSIYRPKQTQTYRVNRPPQTPVLLLVRASSAAVNNALPTAPDAKFFFNFLAWVGADQTVTLPTQLQRNSLKRNTPEPITLTDNLASWRTAPKSVNSGVVLPLSTTISDPIQLTPLKVVPVQ